MNIPCGAASVETIREIGLPVPMKNRFDIASDIVPKFVTVPSPNIAPFCLVVLNTPTPTSVVGLPGSSPCPRLIPFAPPPMSVYLYPGMSRFVRPAQSMLSRLFDANSSLSSSVLVGIIVGCGVKMFIAISGKNGVENATLVSNGR